MNKSDTSPKPDQTRHRIIEAAAQLISELGFTATTTRAIAEAAGVNEVTIFRHFGTKENLAKAVMDQYGGRALVEDIELHFSGDYVQDLTMIGHAMMKVLAERIGALRMAICEAGSFPEFREVVSENPRQLRRMLARYFDRQMQAGLIHHGHPELLAQAFLGIFFSYNVLSGLLMDSLEPQISVDQIVDESVAVFARGTLIKQE